jgi:hypothetical protein
MSDSQPKPRFSHAIVLLAVGIVPRLAPQKIAWPSSFSFSGSRSETQWARMEDTYADVAIVLMCIGGLLIALHYARRQFASKVNT